MTTKVCRHCRNTKGLIEFAANSKSRDGRSSWCRPCHRAAAKQHYHANISTIRQRAKAETTARAQARTEAREAALIGQACAVPWSICGKCGEGFVQRRYGRAARYCSRACQPARKAEFGSQRKPRVIVACPQCATTFETPQPSGQGLRFCSPRCGRKWHALAYRDRKRAAKRTGRQGERVFRRLIFERDGWVCQICGTDVDRNISGRLPLGASLDHIVSLARGGDHSEANVQLAHLICNQQKGAAA